jgi:hypothetical protein
MDGSRGAAGEINIRFALGITPGSGPKENVAVYLGKFAEEGMG